MDSSKKNFNWEKGDQLTDDDYDALGQVRDTGFSKLASGTYADPKLRKEARKQKLSRALLIRDEEFFMEESKSGLSEDISLSESSKLLHKDSKNLKGIGRFKSEDPSKK